RHVVRRALRRRVGGAHRRDDEPRPADERPRARTALGHPDGLRRPRSGSRSRALATQTTSAVANRAQPASDEATHPKPAKRAVPTAEPAGPPAKGLGTWGEGSAPG